MSGCVWMEFKTFKQADCSTNQSLVCVENIRAPPRRCLFGGALAFAQCSKRIFKDLVMFRFWGATLFASKVKIYIFLINEVEWWCLPNPALLSYFFAIFLTHFCSLCMWALALDRVKMHEKSCQIYSYSILLGLIKNTSIVSLITYPFFYSNKKKFQNISLNRTQCKKMFLTGNFCLRAIQWNFVEWWVCNFIYYQLCLCSLMPNGIIPK